MSHFLQEHFSREIGGTWHKFSKKRPCRESLIRQSRKMLRKVVLSNQREFKKLPTIVSIGQVIYDDGKLYIADTGKSTMDCHFVRDGGHRGCAKLSKALSSFVYSIPLKPSWKSQVSFCSSINIITALLSSNLHKTNRKLRTK